MLYVDEEGRVICEWVPRERLLPVRSLPEDLIGNPFAERVWNQRFEDR